MYVNVRIKTRWILCVHPRSCPNGKHRLTSVATRCSSSSSYRCIKPSNFKFYNDELTNWIPWWSRWDENVAHLTLVIRSNTYMPTQNNPDISSDSTNLRVNVQRGWRKRHHRSSRTIRWRSYQSEKSLRNISYVCQPTWWAILFPYDMPDHDWEKFEGHGDLALKDRMASCANPQDFHGSCNVTRWCPRFTSRCSDKHLW